MPNITNADNAIALELGRLMLANIRLAHALQDARLKLTQQAEGKINGHDGKAAVP